MSLKIIRSAEPIEVERLNVVIYAQPGIGKTSAAFTAERPILLDFDLGSHRAANRKDIVRAERWVDVLNITPEDLAPFATVAVDTVGRALDALSADIIERNSKMGRGGALTLQGYGQLKAEFTAWMKQLNRSGKDVVLIAHMDEKQSGDDIIERLDVQGGSKAELYKSADAIGRIVLIGGKRTLVFSPTDAAYGKNPGQLPPMEVPDKDDPAFGTFLADVMSAIKGRLNTLTEEQTQARAALDKWRLAVNDADDADAINALVSEAKEAPRAIKALVHDRAMKLGLTFAPASGTYIADTEVPEDAT